MLEIVFPIGCFYFFLFKQSQKSPARAPDQSSTRLPNVDVARLVGIHSGDDDDTLECDNTIAALSSFISLFQF